jgi:hypothetical protein
MIDPYTLQTISPWNPNRTPTPDDFLTNKYGKYGAFLDFATKDEYIAWRDEWRRVYADLTKEIRTVRAEWRKDKSGHTFTINHAYHSRRALARSMMSLRKASKVRAEQQYLAAKEAAKVA